MRWVQDPCGAQVLLRDSTMENKKKKDQHEQNQVSSKEDWVYFPLKFKNKTREPSMCTLIHIYGMKVLELFLGITYSITFL